MADEILVIGGGFAGFWAALAARRVAGERAVVTLVSREPVLQMRPRLYEAEPETLGIDIVPQPLKYRRSQLQIRGPFAEPDFTYKLGLNPTRSPQLRTRARRQSSACPSRGLEMQAPRRGARTSPRRTM